MKLARCVVMSHDIVVYEDLQVQNLVRNHHLAKSMYDSSWGLFTRWLDYYGKVFDKVVIAVPPQYTSQDCSGCGYRLQKTLSTRTHQCPSCGIVLCRDVNAARVILLRGLEMLGSEWNNGTLGHKGTQEGTLGERCTSADEGQPDSVSMLVEPRTRIPAL